MRPAALWVTLWAVLVAAVWGTPAAAEDSEPLIADLSDHLLAITTGFSGAKVLLFGDVEGSGDVVMVARGPARPESIRRKERILGIWVNRAQADVLDAPAYYRLAATRPLPQIAAPAVLERLHIGVDRLGVRVRRHDKGQNDEDYRQALIRLKVKAGLYDPEAQLITLLNGRLFRVMMDFPANVPTGPYQIEVYLFRNGEVVSAQTTPLIVSKTGVGAEVFDFANRQAALYGIIAILLAAAAGWLAAVAFRRG